MSELHAQTLLERMQATLGGCYAGTTGDGAVRELFTPREILTGDQGHVGVLTDGIATIAGVEHRWSTLVLYRFVGDRIPECWLLPLDPPAFDLVWRA